MVIMQRTPDETFRPASDQPNHGRIVIHDGPVERVGEMLRPTVAPATHVLHEWHEYRISCAGATLLQVGSEQYRSFGEDTGLFRVQFSDQLRLVMHRANGCRVSLTIQARYTEGFASFGSFGRAVVGLTERDRVAFLSLVTWTQLISPLGAVRRLDVTALCAGRLSES